MRMYLGLSAFFAFCVISVGTTSAQSGAWYASAEALILDRNNTFTDPLVIDEDNFPNPVLTGDDLNFGAAGGPKLTLGRLADNGAALEAVYFGRNDWVATASVTGNNNRSVPGDLALGTFDFFAVDQIDVTYGSQIDNFELNYVRHFDGLRLLAGFRYFELDEDFRIASFDNDTFLSDYLIDTQNRLYGGQLGAAYSLFGSTREGAPWELSAGLKAGVFGNANQQTTLLRDLNNALVLRDLTVEGDSTAFIGEINLNAKVNVWRNLDLVVGYNLLWVEGVALAPYQLDFTDTADSSDFVDSTHGVFYHGVNVGLAATW